jgi:hypothetical protein
MGHEDVIKEEDKALVQQLGNFVEVPDSPLITIIRLVLAQ